MTNTIVVTRDKYDEARCRRCGHGAIPHTTTECAATFNSSVFGGKFIMCDCKGWDRDPDWPPPIIVHGAVER